MGGAQTYIVDISAHLVPVPKILRPLGPLPLSLGEVFWGPLEVEEEHRAGNEQPHHDAYDPEAGDE
jgi:hypothetical protein